MVSYRPGGGGLSVVGLLVLVWWHVVEVAVEPLGVVPVHPSQCGELDVVDGSPWSLVGSADQFGLVEPDHCLGESIIERITNGSDRRDSTELGEAFPVADAGTGYGRGR